MTSLGEIASSLDPVLERSAAELSKPKPRLQISGSNLHALKFQTQVGRNLRDALMHIVANSVDHGIESEQSRLDHSKRPVGTVSIDITADDNSIELTIHDDGQGLNLVRLAEKARAADVSSDVISNPSWLAMTIFHDHITTAEHVTKISGRGMGLPAVKSLIEACGGQVSVKLGEPSSIPGYRYFSTVIRLPLSVTQTPTHKPATELKGAA
jgi:two-component system chemotaxis sensor kinase CheA